MKHVVLFLLLISGLPAISQAEQVVVPIASEDRRCKAECPGRGMSMTAVKERFGEPRQAHPPVGTPAISRWEYDAFTVYFERDRVIHTVAAR